MEKQIACKILKSENNALILHKGKKINKIDKNFMKKTEDSNR